MGYTHYWDTKDVTKEDKAGFKKAQPIFKKIIERYKDVIQREYDDNSNPICNKKEIMFNGIGDNGHETFYFNLNIRTGFEFCKTARKCYDAPVCEILEVINIFCPNVVISSDGLDGILGEATDLEENWNDSLINVRQYIRELPEEEEYKSIKDHVVDFFTVPDTK